MDRNLTSQHDQFREVEVAQLLSWARAGESASIIGVSGSGKSNLFNHLIDRRTQLRFLGNESYRYVFVRVNLHYGPDFEPRTLYSLVLEQLELLEEHAEHFHLPPDVFHAIAEHHRTMLAARDDVLLVQRNFRLALHQILGRGEHKMVILLDQFDEPYLEAPDYLFANLRGLRESYKYRLLYFVFTRSSLAMLGLMDRARDEFYELLAANVMGLKMYSPRDSKRLMVRICSRYRFALDGTQIPRYLALSGGHAGLLRAMLLAITFGQVPYAPDVELNVVAKALLEHHNVETECEKIWISLVREERDALSQLVSGVVQEMNIFAFEQLQLKGLLTEEHPPRLFSMVFEEFVRSRLEIARGIVQVDIATRRVWIAGRLCPSLTSPEFRMFKLLLDNGQTIVTHRALAEAAWPQMRGAVPMTAIDSAMAALDSKLASIPGAPKLIESIVGVGYRCLGR